MSDFVERTRNAHPALFRRVRATINHVSAGIDPDHHAALIVATVAKAKGTAYHPYLVAPQDGSP